MSSNPNLPNGAAAHAQQTPDEREQLRQREQDADIQPLSPEEIKAIGEIELGPSRHEQFLNAHYKKLMWGGIALGIVGGSVIAYFSHVNDEAQAAAAQVVEAMKVTAPGAAAAPAEYGAAALAAVQAEHADTASADTAKLMEGLSLLDSKDKERAIADLRDFAATTTTNTPALLRARALCAVATTQMSDGKDDEAVKTWEQLTTLGETPYTALAYMTLGDMARVAGDTEKARNYYTDAVTKCPTSPLVTNKTVQMHMMLLDVDAPKPVTPAKAEDSADPLGGTPADKNSFEEYTPETSGHDSLHSILGTPGESWQTPGL